MASNLGSVFYTVNANTSSLLKAEAVINKSLAKNVEAFDKAEKAVLEFEAAQKKMGRTINEWGQVLNKNNKIVVTASEQYRKLANQASNIREPLLKQTGAAQGVSNALGGVGRSAGQAGIQLQQFIGQVQGGQSAMLALSQQSADLGFVLGFPLLGAIVGISASIAGMLLPNLFAGTKSFKELMEAAKEAADGMDKFTQAQAMSAKIRIGEQMLEATKRAGEAKKQIDDLTNRLEVNQKIIQRYEEGSKTFENLQKAITKTQIELVNANSDLDTATQTLDTLQETLGDVNAALNRAENGFNGAGTSAMRNSEAIKSLIESITLQAETLGYSDRQLALYMATSNKATDAEIAAINTHYDTIEAYQKREEQLKKNKSALDEYNKSSMAQLEAEEKRRQSLTQKVTSIAESGDPLTQLQAERDRQLKLVEEYEALETSVHQTAVDARAAIDAEYESKKAAAMEASFVQQSTANQLIMDGLNSLGDTASNVLTGMVTQTMSLKDAARGLANAIANDAINAIIQMGIQYVKTAVMQQSADQAVLANKQATSAVAAAQHTAAVAATVTELVSLGAAAAFASTAAIPIVGPALAPAAATAAGGAIAGIGASAIAAAPIAGGRLYGGNVNPGTMYPVNENGAPEMFTDGTKQYLMPNTRGEVISNKDATSAGGGLNVYNNIVNNTSAQVTSSSRVEGEGANRKLIIDTVVSDIRSGGATRRAITDSTTAKNRTL